MGWDFGAVSPWTTLALYMSLAVYHFHGQGGPHSSQELAGVDSVFSLFVPFLDILLFRVSGCAGLVS